MALSTPVTWSGGHRLHAPETAVWVNVGRWRRLGHALGIYALMTLLVIFSVPSEGFPLVSMPRFILTDFPIVIALASVIQDRPRLRTSVLVGLGASSAVAGVAFSREIWIA